MEIITIKVDEATAKKWQKVSPKVRKHLEKNLKSKRQYFPVG